MTDRPLTDEELVTSGMTHMADRLAQLEVAVEGAARILLAIALAVAFLVAILLASRRGNTS